MKRTIIKQVSIESGDGIKTGRHHTIKRTYLLAVDALAAGAVATREVAALEHELRDDAVEARALVRQLLARLANALLAGAQGAEVLDRLRDGLAVEAHHNATGGLAVNLNVEEDLVGHLRAGGHELERREKRDGDDL